MNKRTSLLFFLLFETSIVFSQTSDSVKVQELIDLSFEDLLDMPVSSASKIGQKASTAPSIVSVINREQVIKYQWTSLNDIVFKQAGFSPSQDRFNQVIISRGINDLLWSKRLLILFDGVPFSSFQSSVTDQAFSINMAKNVEIIRGPGAALYGSQTVTGVIQVNSLSFSDLKGNGEIRIKVGDSGYRNLNVLTGVKGKNANLLISLNNFSSEGNEYKSYDAVLKKDAQGNFIKQKTQDEKNSLYFWTKLEGRDKLKGFSLSYHCQNYNFQMGHGFLGYFPEIEKTSSVTRNYILAKYVTPRSSKKLVQEYVIKYDNEISRYNMQLVPVGFVRALPDGVLDSAGIYEEYITPINDLFVRTQWIYSFENRATLLAGVEQDIVYYRGDKLHNSNVNLNAPGFIPFNSGKLEKVGSLYEPIKNHPINSTGVYVQLTSGKILGSKLTATLGARYNMYYYTYKNLTTKHDTNRFITHLSPRIALVYTATASLSFKVLYGDGFRFASPFEQFIANSIISGSGRGNIKPEDINNFELSSDWNIRNTIKWRNTLFYSIFKNQIRNSTNSNIFDNVLNTTQGGFASEINILFGSLSAFVNYSFVKRFKETSTDTLIKVSNSLIWYPTHSVNGGFSYIHKKFTFTISGHFQSKVYRRETEKGTPKTGQNTDINYDSLRDAQVKAWHTFDANLVYSINEQLKIMCVVTNLSDQKYNLINNLDGRSPYPFDYQQQGRRVMFELRINL